MWKRQPSLRFRLRLICVKVFSENRYFLKMLFSRKENIFMCLVAFQKNFRKIFSDVGCVFENIIENTFSTCCSHFLS